MGAKDRRCSLCTHPVRVSSLQTTEGVKPVLLYVCVRCDRRRCDQCHRPDLTGRSGRCVCGADLRLQSKGTAA